VANVVFSPPVQRTLRNDVYEAIRRALISGELKPGERINEAEISRQMQISRAPIREAIRQLEQEGLLVNLPRRGTFVVSLTRADVEEVYTLRADIERRAVEQAIHHLNEAQYDTLENLYQQMLRAAEAGDLTELLEMDIQLHRTIIEAANWPRLRKIWESLQPQALTLYTLLTVSEWSPLVHAQRHEPLLAALRSGDAVAAGNAIHDHIMGVSERVITHVPD
jgi:DNA-binding GntR family transcriptional regulator